MDLSEFFRAGFAEHAALLRATEERLAGPFAELVGLTAGTLRGGGKLLFFGNGGSAADAQHLATEFTVRFVRDRAALPALALTADTATLTAIGNDYGFERLFARQIEAHGRPGDLAIGLSTSGRSPNVVAGLRAAGALGLGVAAFTGGDGGDLPGLARPLLCVPSRVTARIQEMHMLLGHLLCGAVERELGVAGGD